MAEETFDPEAAGAVAVEEPKQFDPTQFGAVPVQEPKQEGGVLSGIVAGLGRALNPINLVKGALDIGHPSDISNIIQYGKTLGEIVTGTPPDQAIGQNIPELQQQRQAVYGQLGGREQAAALTGIGLQLGLTALPFIHGEVLPRGPLAEVAGIAKPEVAPETAAVSPPVPEAPSVVEPPLASEVAASEPVSPEVAPQPSFTTGEEGAVNDALSLQRAEPQPQPVPEAVAPVTAEPLPETPQYETTQTQPNVVPTVSTGETGYRPDPTAPKEGEYITAPDPTGFYNEVAVGWRQNHEELVRNALNKWKGSPTDIRFHLREEANGSPQPDSGGAKQTRAQAAALLYELDNNAKTTPTLYRGDGVDPKTGEPYPWSESKEVAQEFAGKNGTVYELPAGQKGLRIQDYAEKPSVLDAEKEWIVRTQKPTEGGEISAVQEPSAGEILQRQPEETGAPGGLGLGVEQGVEGEKVTEASPEEVAPTVPQPEQPRTLPEGWVEEGLHSEYPEIGKKMDRYIMDNDVHGIFDALKDPRYEEYHQDLQRVLQQTYGDEIPVSRIASYGTGGTGKSGGLAYVSVSTTPGWGEAASKQGYEIWRGAIKPEDVIAAGHEAEGELIVKKSGIKTEPDVVSTVPSGKTVELAPVPAAAEPTTAEPLPKTEAPSVTTEAEKPIPDQPGTVSTPPEVQKETGISNQRLVEAYGDSAPVATTGKGPGAWKDEGLSRLDNFQQTGDVANDPYAVLTNLREGKVPMAQVPSDVSLLRSEHQRLLEDARNSEGTPEYADKSKAALDMATAIKGVAHGPASDVFRALQEYDQPRYDNVTDFDQALREREGRESTPQEINGFKKIADDVASTKNGAEEAINGAQKQIGRYPKMSFDDAAKSIHDQITELTKDCVL